MVTEAAAAPVLPGGAGAERAGGGGVRRGCGAGHGRRPAGGRGVRRGRGRERAGRQADSPHCAGDGSRRSQFHRDIVEAGRADGQRPRGSGQTAAPIRSPHPAQRQVSGVMWH